jgi:hypothetical protein
MYADGSHVVTASRRTKNGVLELSWVSALRINDDPLLQKHRTLDIIAGKTLYVLSSLKMRLRWDTL